MKKDVSDDGYLVCPAFDGKTGERVHAFDMHVWLGPAKDPARKHADAIESIIAHDDLYSYEFYERDIKDKPTFSMTVTPHDNATPIGSIDFNKDVGDRFYKMSREVYRHFHRVGVKEEERIENERRR